MSATAASAFLIVEGIWRSSLERLGVSEREVECDAEVEFLN